jgi:hypothetical protein
VKRLHPKIFDGPVLPRINQIYTWLKELDLLRKAGEMTEVVPFVPAVTDGLAL